jgi:hypothetical protein
MQFCGNSGSSIEKPCLNESLALLYLSCANANLLSHNDLSALQDYQKALEVLGDAGDSGLEFLISYGMVVACDRLQIRDQCESHLLRLRAVINSPEADDAAEYELPENASNDIPDYLRALAAEAPSLEIRGALQSFVSEVFIGFYSHSDHRSNLGHKSFVAKPCKSFWKKLEKLAHNIRRACEKVLDVIERSLNVWDRIEGKLKNQEEDNKSLV